MPNKDVFEIEGGIGELDYGGIMLKSVDILVENIAKKIVMPEVKRRINSITGETERSIHVKREGFFDPRPGVAKRAGVGPVWSVFNDDTVEHPIILEFAYGGRNAIFRPSARARKVKAEIRAMVLLRFGPTFRAMVRNAKRKRVRK